MSEIVASSMLIFDDLAGGEVKERFDSAIAEVMENIANPDTPSGKRTVTIVMDFHPTTSRDLCDVDIKVTAKVKPQRGVPTTVSINTDSKGNLVAREYFAQQTNLPV